MLCWYSVQDQSDHQDRVVNEVHPAPVDYRVLLARLDLRAKAECEVLPGTRDFPVVKATLVVSVRVASGDRRA